MKRLIVYGNTSPPRYALLLSWVRGHTTDRPPKFIMGGAVTTTEAILLWIANDPLLSDSDAELILVIARSICPESNETFMDAARHATTMIHNFRYGVRSKAGKELAESLPVRKASPAGDGGGRYYWRVLVSDGCVVSAVDETRARGQLSHARAKAVELYCNGRIPVELIPPDIDPQAPDEREPNRSGSQMPGMTKRQRQKRHC